MSRLRMVKQRNNRRKRDFGNEHSGLVLTVKKNLAKDKMSIHIFSLKCRTLQEVVVHKKKKKFRTKNLAIQSKGVKGIFYQKKKKLSLKIKWLSLKVI